MLDLLQSDLITLLFILITMFWWLEFVFFKKEKETKEKKDKSFIFILIAIVFTIIFSLLLYNFEILNITSNLRSTLRVLSIIIYGLGLFIRYWSLITLGNHFSRQIDVEKEQTLVSHGPYRLLRHPSYTGLFLLNLGVQLFISNILGLIAGIIIILIVLIYRMKIEEKQMTDVIGNKYVKWKESRDRLIPFIY